MLKSKPTGAGKKLTARWEATNRMTIEMFKAYWQSVSPDLEFPLTQAGDEASCAEWEGKDRFGNNCKFQGMRKAGGDRKHGIVRAISNDGRFIQEATYYENEMHGLSFVWRFTNGPIAFRAEIYNHGEEEAYITWYDDWSEYYSSGDKELILENNGLSIFKP